MIQLNKKAIRNLPIIKNLSNSICKQCQHGKKTRVKFKTKEYSTTKPLEIIHTDVCGTMRKSETFSCFQVFK